MAVNQYVHQNGECPICGKVTKLEFHHIIPRSLHIETNNRRFVLVHKEEGNKVTFVPNISKKFRLENIMVRLCRECHGNVHMNFKKYRLPFSKLP